MSSQRNAFTPYEWLASNFYFQYHPSIKHKAGHENKGNDPQFKKLLIVKQILLVRTIGNVKRTMWRMWILMIGCKGLNFKFVICNPCYSSLSSTILPPFWFILSPLESICFNKLFKCFIPVNGDPLTTFNCVAPVITECSNTFEVSVTYWSNAMDILLTSSLSLARLPELGLLVSSLYFFGS